MSQSATLPADSSATQEQVPAEKLAGLIFKLCDANGMFMSPELALHLATTFYIDALCVLRTCLDLVHYNDEQALRRFLGVGSTPVNPNDQQSSDIIFRLLGKHPDVIRDITLLCNQQTLLEELASLFRCLFLTFQKDSEMSTARWTVSLQPTELYQARQPGKSIPKPTFGATLKITFTGDSTFDLRPVSAVLLVSGNPFPAMCFGAFSTESDGPKTETLQFRGLPAGAEDMPVHYLALMELTGQEQPIPEAPQEQQ